MSKGPEMRRALLAKLPPLPYHGFTVTEAIRLDTDDELKSVVQLDADAFLAPLETVTRRGPR
jgi:hypothetical protein